MPKVIKSGARPEFFAKGGSGKMFGPQHASPMPEGTTSRPDGGKASKWPEGGKGHMFGKQTTSPIPEGRTGK